jgi:ankyrin repeat protein
MVRVLISHGADVNAEDEWDDTPLHEAMTGDRAEADMVRLLAAHGADVNAENDLGGTPLGRAAGFKDIDVVEALLACGAKPDRVNRFDGTAVLHWSVSKGQLDIVEMFLKHDADVNVRDVDRQTPLHEAAWANDRAMAELLLAQGAEISARDKNGDTPAHVAAVNRCGELFDFLASKGADMGARNDQGQTPVEVLRLSPASEGVMLSAPSASPYAVIIANLRAVRGLLRSYAVRFDRIWIVRRPS